MYIYVYIYTYIHIQKDKDAVAHFNYLNREQNCLLSVLLIQIN